MEGSVPELKLLFLQMLVILVAARLAGAAFRIVGQPSVVGEMAAGLLLGPSLLGRVFPAAMNSLFSADGLGPLYALSQVGLVLFMFLMGLEVRPGAIRGSARSVAVASQASILAPFVAGVSGLPSLSTPRKRPR
jgi:Kef-type K+ transport system membrane component KefB